jgi:ribosome maturation factor RimP
MKAQIAAALHERGLELCHVAWKAGAKQGVLTLTIDKEGGVSMADCEVASRAASELLDAEGAEVPPIEYSLEVESPGLDRPLWTLDDCRRFTGRRVAVRLNRKVDGAGRLKGVLESVDTDTLTVLDEDQNRRYTVRFDDVKLARLVPEF